jgi:hypothetical protein
MNKTAALALVHKHGYLNEFASMSDSWFVAHSVPGEETEASPLIPSNIALRLITGEGAPLEERGFTNPREDDPTFSVTWYAPKAAEPRRE